MNTLRRLFSVALLIIASLVSFSGCRTVDRTPAPHLAVEFRALSNVYRKSTASHRRAFRKPIRDERAKAMRLLAAKAGQMADDSHVLLVIRAVTDTGPTISATEHDAVAGFQDSLRSLEAAARRGEVSAVRAAYVHAAHRYGLLEDVTNAPPSER